MEGASREVRVAGGVEKEDKAITKSYHNTELSGKLR